MSADESKTAGVTATDGGYPAAGEGEGHGHAAHGESKGHGGGHAHGDGHNCETDHGSGDGHGHGGHGGDEGHGHGADADGEDDGEAPDMAGLEAMMGGMGGGEGGAGGMDMNALMAMMGKGGGKGGGGGMDMASMMGGMGGGMGGMGGKGGGKGQAPPEDTDEKKGEKWHWMQKGEEVHIRFPLDPPATSKKDISVTFKSNTLKVAIRGESTLDGTLGGKVDVDDCTWLLSPEKDELQVMLTKVEGKTDAWRDLLA